MDLSEVQIFSLVQDVYPLIDPNPHFSSKTYKDKVVIITGASKGIGATTALFYARAGANLVLVARGAEGLAERKKAIESEVPGAQIEVVAGDVADPNSSKSAVQSAVQKWGRLDIVIANSGIGQGGLGKFAERDLQTWWYTQEVNVRGTLSIIHAAVPELLKTKGQVIVLTSQLAHVRVPFFADYSISKHTINRLVEIIALDYPEIAWYSVHPGVILTPGAGSLAQEIGVPKEAFTDTVELPAATFLWLTARNAEFLNGRYVQASWDLNEVLAKKEEIVRDNLLVTKLAGPSKSA